MKSITKLFSIIFLVTTSTIIKSVESSCGYEKCKQIDPSTLNVHLIPHSHNDLGWLQTVDEYYDNAVEKIISSVVRELPGNPERRFVQVETAFLKMWWDRQNDETRNDFKKLVEDGQIEITGGGWCMNDEGVAHYLSIIDLMTLGFQFLKNELGECGRPNIGWQIDPFGHSREMASIFAQMGFDGFFFGRLDYRDKDARVQNKELETIWRGSSNFGESTDIFTSVLYNTYDPPPGFCFDIYCGDPEIIDDDNDPSNNVRERVETFANYVRRQADHYKSSNILLTMGDDFQYQDSSKNYRNLDKLIRGFQSFPQDYNGKTINVFYSTPACYVKAIHDEMSSSNLHFSLKTDDFLPMASGAHVDWSGYFTSRATSKRFERFSNNLLQVAKQLSVLSGRYNDGVMDLMDAVGIMQHHDAITGTEKQYVADDYYKRLTDGLVHSTTASNAFISELLKVDAAGGDVDLNLNSCLLSNVSYCPETRNDRFIVTVYNPLSQLTSHYVELPVDSTGYTILNPNGDEIPYQISKSPRNFDYTGFETSPYTLIFYAEDLPPLGLKVFYVTRNANADHEISEDTSDQRYNLGNDELNIEIDSNSGKLKSIAKSGFHLDVSQELMFYYEEGNSYVFRPAGNNREALPINGGSVATATYKGDLFDEIHQEFADWAGQVIRVYKHVPYVVFDYVVGPVTLDNDNAKNVISRFTTQVDSGDVFYTDSNGKQTIKRTRGYRPSYTYTDEEPIAGNYYPVVSKLSINDSTTEFAVLNDRAQGGSSLRSGELELMLLRVCPGIDGNMNENLVEFEYGQPIVVRGKHFVVLGPVSGGEKSTVAIERDVARKQIFAPWAFVAAADDREILQRQIKFEFAGLKNSLPENVQILTLETRKDNQILLRLEHILEAGEDEYLSGEVTVNLNELFSNFEIKNLRETTLGGNQWLEDNKRLEWPVVGFRNKDVKSGAVKDVDDLRVTLKPTQIRTFIAELNYY